jgi:hypothetical protein
MNSNHKIYVVPRFYGKYVYRIVASAAEESRDQHVLLVEHFNSFSLFDFVVANRFAILAMRQTIVAQVLDAINTICSHRVFIAI